MIKPTRFLTNEKGKPLSVVIRLDDYKKILALIEELESIRAYDQAKASREKPIPLTQARREFRRARK